MKSRDEQLARLRQAANRESVSDRRFDKRGLFGFGFWAEPIILIVFIIILIVSFV